MKRHLAILFSLIIVVLPLSQDVARASSSASTSTTVNSSAAKGEGSREIVSMRTQSSRTYAEDGHFRLQVFPGSINYKDASGSWQPIENTLVPSSVSGYAYENKRIATPSSSRPTCRTNRFVLRPRKAGWSSP